MVFRRSVESHISPTGKMDCKLARKIEIKCALQSSCSFLWKGFIWKAPCQSRHLLSEWRAALSSGAARESQSLMQVLCRFSLPKSPKVPHKYMAPWMPCIVPFVRSVIDICKRKPHSICKQRADPEQAAMRPHRSKGIISVPLRLLPHCPRWIGFLLAPKLIFFLLECRYHYIRYLKKTHQESPSSWWRNNNLPSNPGAFKSCKPFSLSSCCWRLCRFKTSVRLAPSVPKIASASARWREMLWISSMERPFPALSRLLSPRSCCTVPNNGFS